MITDFGITDFWLHTFIFCAVGIIFTWGFDVYIQTSNYVDAKKVARLLDTVILLGFVLVVISGCVYLLNNAELYNNGLQTIQDSIYTTGDIPTRSALLCQISDIDTRQCNLDMFDWYMENHYDPTSNASMRVAMQMRGNVG